MTEHDDSTGSDSTEREPDADPLAERTTGSRDTGRTPQADSIEPAAPEEFGLVQVWWGDGKGKTTAALGMGMRAVGHGYRVHCLQFMKGGAASVEDVRGEYNTMAALPGFSFENIGQYGWHGRPDGTDERDHEDEAQAGLERARELLDAARDTDLTTPIAPHAPPEAGMHMLILDEICYAADRELIAPETVVDLVSRKPGSLELVLTGSHDRPEYLVDHVDLVTNVRAEKHPIEDGQRARMGTEF
jgi:cob(I)alamin adenosyltransferase